jgi:transmembrane sensor
VDDLIIRVLNGEASPFEAERLSRWKDESSENAAYYREMAQVWALTAPEPQDVVSSPPSAREIIRVADSEISETSGGERPGRGQTPGQDPESRPQTGESSGGIRRHWPPWKAWGLLAASVAALALGIRATGAFGPDPLAEYLAPARQSQTVTLADGSLVRLAGGSRLQVWGEGEIREVSLEGRAFFAVTKDESRPFVVRVGAGEIRVLGTRFEVAEEETGTRTVVIEGLVAVSNPAGSVEVPAGSLARMSRGDPPVAEAVEDPWSLLDWPDGILVFQETPLSQVAAEVSHHFGRPILVSGSELGNRRITAWFQGESFDEVAEALCLVVDAACGQGDSGVTMRARGDAGEVR